MSDQTCCRLRYLSTPSGLKLSHSRFCRVHPGERLVRTNVDPAEIEHQERMAEILVRTKRTPSGRQQSWSTHPVDCQCDDCAYVEAALDRDDA